MYIVYTCMYVHIQYEVIPPCFKTRASAAASATAVA